MRISRQIEDPQALHPVVILCVTFQINKFSFAFRLVISIVTTARASEASLFPIPQEGLITGYRSFLKTLEIFWQYSVLESPKRLLTKPWFCALQVFPIGSLVVPQPRSESLSLHHPPFDKYVLLFAKVVVWRQEIPFCAFKAATSATQG